MKISYCSSPDKRGPSEVLVIPFWEKKNAPSVAADFEEYASTVHPVFKSQDFQAERGEVVWLYPAEGKDQRLLLLGLGKEKECQVEDLRQAYSECAKAIQKKGLPSLTLLLPQSKLFDGKLIAEGVAEGFFLTNYVWEKLKKLDEQTVLVEEMTFVGASSEQKKEIKKISLLSEAVHMTRDLINGNADQVTPKFLVEVAHSLAKRHASIKVKALDVKELKKEKCGLLLAVARGSETPPALLTLQYSGGGSSKKPTLLVGKGVTYDTGGLSLKPTSGMVTMRDDMSGAAAVLGTFFALAELKLKVNVVAVLPLTENSIDAKSFKPGDVYEGYSGHTVEIRDTDAEGRLILADALAYGIDKFQPTEVIDLATLTGSVVRALGHDVAGLYSNHDKLCERLINASQQTSEQIWRLPLIDSYRSSLKSDIADIKNLGGAEAGSIKAALFLETFVGSTPWAHLDIGGTAFLPKERGYLPKNGVGYGVRLLIRYFENFS